MILILAFSNCESLEGFQLSFLSALRLPDSAGFTRGIHDLGPTLFQIKETRQLDLCTPSQNSFLKMNWDDNTKTASSKDHKYSLYTLISSQLFLSSRRTYQLIVIGESGEVVICLSWLGYKWREIYFVYYEKGKQWIFSPFWNEYLQIDPIYLRVPQWRP